MHFSELFQFCPVCGSQRFVLNNEKSKRCDQCGFVFYVNASAAVAAFIRNEAGDLLVCRRAKEPAKGTLDLPGGFVDDAETAEQAVRREIKEELQVEVEQTEFLFSLPNNYLYSGMTIPTLDLFFACTLPAGSKIVPADDVAEAFFVPVAGLQPAAFGLDSIRKSIEWFICHSDKKQ